MLFKRYEVPFALGWDEWETWEAETARKYPIQFFFRSTLRRFFRRRWNAVHDTWHWLKCLLWNRYNVIVVKSIPCTGADQDDMILHGAFQCLCNFIEKEQPWEFAASAEEVAAAYDEIYDTVYGPVDTRRSDTWASIKELYAWWQARKSDWDDHDEDDAMLRRLIEVRGYLWT